jgi:multisubunit Na+/H+ antiporter MnhC subunit
MSEHLELFAIALFFISFFGIITSRNIIKSIIFVLLSQTAAVMLWLVSGMGESAEPKPPIIYDVSLLENTAYISDPLPQSLTLTAIIIGFAVTAIVITMFNTLYREHKTVDWKKMRKLATETEGEE